MNSASTSPASLGLRQRLRAGDVIWAPTVYDGMSARIAANLGFEMLSVGGFAAAATYGLPDLGLLTMSELVETVRRCAIASGLPITVDADTGFGGPLNIRRTVQELEQVGACGLQIEDQASPKKCPFLQANEMVSPSEGAERIRAARDACKNDATLIIARTDTLDLDEAITRGQLYARAGADALFILPGCVPTAEHMRRLSEAIELPLSYAVFSHTPTPTRAEIERLSSVLGVVPLAALLGAAQAVHANLSAFREGAEVRDIPSPEMAISTFGQLMGVNEAERSTQQLKLA